MQTLFPSWEYPKSEGKDEEEAIKRKEWKKKYGNLFPIEMKHISLPNGIYPFR